MALLTGGDGVVIAKFGLLSSTTSPKSMNLQIIQNYKLITWIWVLLLNQEEKFSVHNEL
jgi:hypothetical protein